MRALLFEADGKAILFFTCKQAVADQPYSHPIIKNKQNIIKIN
jgi:hypothetical protein